MLFGILTAVVLVATQASFYFSPQQAAASEESTNGDPADADQDDQTRVSLGTFTVASSLTLSVHQEAIMLFEWRVNQDEIHSPRTEVSVATGRFFQTLFRLIISPNAP